MDGGLASHDHEPSGDQRPHKWHYVRGTHAGHLRPWRGADQRIGQRDPRRPGRSHHQRASTCEPHHLRAPRLHDPGPGAVWGHPRHPGCRRHVDGSAASREGARSHLNPAGARKVRHRRQRHVTYLCLHYTPFPRSLGNHHHGAEGLHGARAVGQECTDLLGRSQAGGHRLIASPSPRQALGGVTRRGRGMWDAGHVPRAPVLHLASQRTRRNARRAPRHQRHCQRPVPAGLGGALSAGYISPAPPS